ncbi:nucleolar exit protein [Scheffersomyces stipitis CBS 6054]|uniref:Nucleolar exit protein n=1 Tax=Scheffersomyces stipitis (strain ATCC 58785 / CBS 6054 / NBRC 10063 / NRRL Y-11545) TaxID=322104 RepID=A3LUE9_PICST|nr:nucleolar exit protein [Scheffersomyces stipitis CBS 6054]ABN66227.2 nucleolar exit protein [Scheffersomyces stipitis CBS 6054]
MAKIKLQVLLVPSYFASVPTALVDPHLTKRFLHLADPTIELGNIDKDIDSRYRKLYPDESPLNIEKLQDNDNCDLDPEFRIQDVLTNGDVLRIVVRNIFHHNPSSISSNTGTPLMSKSFDVMQSTPLYPSEHLLLGDTTLPMTGGYASSNHFRPPQEFFETPHNNRLLLPPQHQQQQFQNQQLQQNQQFQQNQHNPQFPVVVAETPKLVVRKGRRRASSRADFDESNISLPPPESRPDRVVPTKRIDTTKSNSSISGRRITSGMLTMPHQHPESVDQDNLFGSATRDTLVPHSVTISDYEDEDVDDTEVPLVKKKGRPAKKKRGPKPKVVAPTHNMSDSDETLPQPKPKRRIGRPKGSKNRQPRTVDDTLSKSEMIEMIKSSMNDTGSTRERVVAPPQPIVKTPAQAAIIKSLEITMNDTPKSRKRTAKPVGRPPNKVTKPTSKRNSIVSPVTESKSKLLESKHFNSKDINNTGVSVQESINSNTDSHDVTGTNGESSHVNFANVSSLLEKSNGQESKSDIVVDSNEEEDIYVDTSSTLGRLYMKMKNFENRIRSHTSDVTGYPKKMSPEPNNDDNVINSAILNPTINLVMHMRNTVPNVPAAPPNRVTPSKPASTYTPKPGSRPRGRPPKNPRVTPIKKDTKVSKVEAAAAKRAPNTTIVASPVVGATAVSSSIPIGGEKTESIDSHASTSTSAAIPDALGTQTTEYSVIPNSNPHAGLESGVSQLHSNNNNSSNNTSNNNKATVEQVSNGILLENSRPSGSPPAAQVAAPRVSHPIPTSSFFSNSTPTTYNESEVIDSKVNTYGSPSTSATSTIATQPVEHKNGSTLSNLVHQGERDATVHNVDVAFSNNLGDVATNGTNSVGALQSVAVVESTNNVFIENSGSKVAESTTGSNFPEKILSAKVEETGSDKLGIDSKKRMNDSSSGESSDDGSSDSEAESKKKPRLVASIPSLLRRSQSPISAIVSTAKNIVADAAVVPQQAKTPAKAFPSFNDWVASKPPVGPGATAILNRSPSAFGPEKTTVRKPILSSLEDLATRGVPDVKESTTKESTHGTSATKKNVFEDDDDSDEDETSSDDDGSDDDFSDESGVNDGSEKFLSMKKAVARKNKAKKNLFSSLRR